MIMKSNNPTIIQQQAVVIAAYYGNSKGVNLRNLVRLWEESSDFENEYPYVANNFQIRSCPVNGDLILSDLIEDFAYTPHIKIWVMGEELEGEDLNHYLNYLMIGDRCGRPIYQIGQEVCFEYRNENGYVTVSGTITELKSDLEFCSWLCSINGIWYDQYLVGEQQNA